MKKHYNWSTKYPKLIRFTGLKSIFVNRRGRIKQHTKGKYSRSFANNLIEGSHEQVVEFLDRLSARQGGVDKDQWRAQD
jgi:hypothetical protein